VKKWKDRKREKQSSFRKYYGYWTKIKFLAFKGYN
jgi:hypothetical protein